MWNLLINNYYCNEKDIFRTNKIHCEKLLNAKTHIDNKEPLIPKFFQKKIYFKQFLKAKERKIKIGNNIMYKKLISVVNTFSPYSKTRNIPKYCAAFDKQKFNFSKLERERNISSENHSFYERFIRGKSHYPLNYYLQKSEYEDYIKHNISKTKFLPKVTLKLLTFKGFKNKLMQHSSIINDPSALFHDVNVSAISKTKSKIKRIHLDNDIHKNDSCNNIFHKSDMYKQKPKYRYKNLKRCQSVKLKTSNKIKFDF